MIGDKHIASATSRAIGIGLMAGEIEQLIFDLRWLIALSFALIIADFWLGISESKAKKKEIRKSKAFRRTFNKLVDYICYLMVAGLLGKAIGEPLGIDAVTTAAVTMLLACAWELDSIYGHICYIHGFKQDYSIRKFIYGWFKRKSQAIHDAVDEAKLDATSEKSEDDE